MLPRLLTPLGWLAFRSHMTRRTSDRASAASPSRSRSQTWVTTAPWSEPSWSAVRRYRGRRSCAVKRITSPPGRTASTLSRISPISAPKAPALPATAAPAVPGIPTPKARPDQPQSRRCRRRPGASWLRLQETPDPSPWRRARIRGELQHQTPDSPVQDQAVAARPQHGAGKVNLPADLHHVRQQRLPRPAPNTSPPVPRPRTGCGC